MKTFAELQEGVYDPNIFKAIFLAGGPGSGKSYVVRRTTGGLGMKIVNSDDVYEKMLKDVGLDTTPEDIYSDQGQDIRVKAKKTVKTMQSNYIEGRLGHIIDGTGKDYDKISKQVSMLRSLGYDCYMVFVNTSLDTAQQRNSERKRTLPEKEVEKMWKGVQQNIGKFQRLFGSSSFIIVDNNDKDEDMMQQVFKRVRALATRKVQNQRGLQWIRGELEKKKRK